METIIRAKVPKFEDAMSVATAGFAAPETDEFQQEIAAYLDESDRLYSIEVDGELGGFAVFRSLFPVLYLSCVILRPEYQRKGLAQQAIQLAQQKTGAYMLAFRTQSAVMYVAGHRTVAENHWYPRADSEMENYLATLQRGVLDELGMESPLERGFYKRRLYGRKPEHYDPAVQQQFDSICDFDRGDAVLCIGHFPAPPHLRRFGESLYEATGHHS